LLFFLKQDRLYCLSMGDEAALLRSQYWLPRIDMSAHKFKIGQGLSFVPRRITALGPVNNPCKVIRLLPAEADEPQYRIKCMNENFERVVREGELS
jgi:hypothetical protein